MPKAKLKRPDPTAYARAHKASRGGRLSWFDKRPEATEAVEKFIVEWRAGRSDMGVPQACEYLKEYFDYPYGADSLRSSLAARFRFRVRG
jgi:hypothetical protein